MYFFFVFCKKFVYSYEMKVVDDKNSVDVWLYRNMIYFICICGLY